MLYNATPDFIDTPQKYIDQCGEDYVQNDWNEYDDEQIELLKKCVSDKYMDVYEHVAQKLLEEDYNLAYVKNGVLNMRVPKKCIDISVMYGSTYGYQVWGEYGDDDINEDVAATGDVTNDAIAIICSIIIVKEDN